MGAASSRAASESSGGDAKRIQLQYKLAKYSVAGSRLSLYISIYI